VKDQDKWDRIEVYDEVLGHLDIVSGALTEGEQKQAEILKKRWRKAQEKLVPEKPTRGYLEHKAEKLLRGKYKDSGAPRKLVGSAMKDELIAGGIPEEDHWFFVGNLMSKIGMR